MTFIQNQQHHYDFYLAANKRFVLAYPIGVVGVYPVCIELTNAQEKRWWKEGAPYIQQLYEESMRTHKPSEPILLAAEVAAQLERDFTAVLRPRVAHHLAQYGPARPEATRVQLAMLKLARGDLHVLKRHLRDALVDYRDVLQLAGDFDAVQPLAPGASGIDLQSGALVAREITINPETLPSELAAAGLTDTAIADIVPDTTYVPLARPLDIANARFNVTLVFEHEGLAAAHLTMVGEDRADAWLADQLAGTPRVFSWGKIDLEREGDSRADIVLRYRY